MTRNSLLSIILFQSISSVKLPALASKVIKRGNNLFQASVPLNMKLNSVSKKLFIESIFILDCQVLMPAPTNNSRPKKPVKILKNDRNIKTNKIIFPDSTTLNVI